jgi:hypothetical protein
MSDLTSVQAPIGAPKAKSYIYNLQGTLLEACSCNVLCPCWIGENPDGGSCKAFLGYHFAKGEINGVRKNRHLRRRLSHENR